MRLLNLYKVAPLVLIPILAGCFGEETLDGMYVVNKERSMSAKNNVKGVDLTDPSETEGRANFERALDELGKMEIVNDSVTLGSKECKRNEQNEIQCGKNRVEGVLSLTSDGAKIVSNLRGDRIEVHFDRL